MFPLPSRRDVLRVGPVAVGLPTLVAPARAAPPAPRARAVILLFMDGGPSQMDTFDPKPRLDREHGKPIQAKVQPTQFNNVGTVLKSPWKFRQSAGQA